jgi:hypothetical protein
VEKTLSEKQTKQIGIGHGSNDRLPA